MTFKDKLFVEYPIPRDLSCWGALPGVKPIESIDDLIETAVDELASDVVIDGSIEATGMITQMPEGTITCTSAMLSGIYPFQGNRLVKVTYDSSTKRAYLRYYPAIINYRRFLTKEDLETLKGDRLIYIKSYVLWKMAERELSILKLGSSVPVDNGQIDLTTLEKFADNKKDYYNNIKNEILMYSTVN